MRGMRFILRMILLAGVLAWFFPVGPALAESLWNQGGAKSLYSATPQSWQVGDLIVVIIVEQAQATQTAGTEAKKSSGIDADLEASVGTPVNFESSGSAGLSGGNDLKATGKTTRGGSVRAQLTSEVLAVLPNGRLQIQGRQTIMVNGEKQEITLTGVVRTQDISRDNTVLSTLIADAEISFRGVGTLGAQQSQGLLTRFWNWLF